MESHFQALHLSDGPPHAGFPLPAPHLPRGAPGPQKDAFPQLASCQAQEPGLCVSPRDLGQMVPANISRHSAGPGSSLTWAHVRPRWDPRARHPACVPSLPDPRPSGPQSPTPRLPAHHPPVSPSFPRGRPLSVLAEQMKAHGTFPAPSRLWGLDEAPRWPCTPHRSF